MKKGLFIIALLFPFFIFASQIGNNLNESLKINEQINFDKNDINSTLDSLNTKSISRLDDGEALGIFYDGTTAYAGFSTNFEIFDVTDKSNIKKLGECFVGGPIKDIKVRGNYAYVADDIDGLWIIDVSDKNNPIKVGHCETQDNALSVFVEGNYAYVADDDAGIRIIDISNPEDPKEISFYDTYARARDIFVKDQYAYVANEYGGLLILNISNKLSPAVAGSLDTGGRAKSIYVDSNRVYLADRSDGLRIIDVSDPSAPTELGYYDTDGEAIDVMVINDTAYVADSTNGLVVIDAVDPSNLKLIKKIDRNVCKVEVDSIGYAFMSKGFEGVDIKFAKNGIVPVSTYNLGFSDNYNVFVVDNYEYVTNRDSGLIILDISNPASPQKVSQYAVTGTAFGLYVLGNYAYIGAGAGGLRIIDVSDKTSPAEVGFYDTPSYAYNVFVVDSFVYIADSSDGVIVVNVSDKTNPQYVGGYDTPGIAFGIYVEGNYAYVADANKGLRILDVTDKTNITEVGYYDNVVGYSVSVALQGNYVYLGGEYDILRVLDISDKTNPVEVGSYETTDSIIEFVKVSGNKLYASCNSTGFVCLDITDRTNPTEIERKHEADYAGLYIEGDNAYLTAFGSNNLYTYNIKNFDYVDDTSSYDEKDLFVDMAVNGNYLYVTDIFYGLEIWDISDKTNPVEVGSYCTDSLCEFLCLDSNYVYIGGKNGIYVIDVTDKSNPVLTGLLNTGNIPDGDLYVSGNYLYVADGTNGLRIVDISDKANPQQVSSFNTSGYANSVYVDGDYAYVADGDSGIVIIDVKYKANPSEIGRFDTDGNAFDIAIKGNYAYVADGSNGLLVLDVSDKTAPDEVDHYYENINDEAYNVGVLGNNVYVTLLNSGLRLLKEAEEKSLEEIANYDPCERTLFLYPDTDYIYVTVEGGLYTVGYIYISLNNFNRDRYYVGEKDTIRWTTNDIQAGNVELSYYVGNEKGWHVIDTVANTGIYEWTVPNTPSNSCLLKVKYLGYEGLYDVSDTFSIIGKVWAINEPAYEDILYSGSDVNIMWNTYQTVDGNIFVYFSSDSGNTWQLINSASEEDTQIVWHVPNVISYNCFIKMVNENDSMITEISDQFAVLPRNNPVSIVYPSKGDTLFVGGLTTLRWKSVYPVDVYLSTNGGASYDYKIASGIKPLSSEGDTIGTYELRIPNIPGRYTKMKIEAINGLVAETDSFFTISSDITQKYVKAVSTGDGVEIKWATNPGVPVIEGYNIYYVKNGVRERLNGSILKEGIYTDRLHRYGEYEITGINGLKMEQVITKVRVAPERYDLSFIEGVIMRSGNVRIGYSVANDNSKIKLSIYTMDGRKVRDVYEGRRDIGDYEESVEGLKGGVYFVIYENPAGRIVRKFTVVR